MAITGPTGDIGRSLVRALEALREAALMDTAKARRELRWRARHDAPAWRIFNPGDLIFASTPDLRTRGRRQR